ncbi:MAG TPA: nitronate monooxygenase family protein [Petrotogaceae bacterium]|nr:nitronate monooxygenase family protein [Petrotogaceae bacterium]HNY37258.1 nitronate monooxygenase family protein [Petrotogaceae bacterium]HOG33892.1 nitronate monooxygenase family protein [Petrotogaceae bacterium]HPA92984.1 nitronate monooxygenase family protein [Petrotogaceae bacterium]HPX16765.1 nitronate monooxygenase family protein [Petrotogaceae bacterium]
MKGLNINGLESKIPLIQGGMAVGISLDRLSSAVANEGGIGVIGTAGIGMFFEEYGKDYKAACIEGLKKVITGARQKTSGIIGVNIMAALSNYSDMVRTAVEEKIDLIISGAGLALDLPSYLMAGTKTRIIPIVSGLRAATLIFKRWFSRYGYIPDAFIVEGPKAGGHLGYKKENIYSEEHQLENTVPQVRELCEKIKREFGKEVPLIAAGGVFDHNDVQAMLKLGADGVQAGTVFIATHECDADDRFKNAVVNADKEDIIIIDSPVGMPGRAVRNKFLEDVGKGIKKPVNCAYRCIKTCNMKDAPYCIARALSNAARGDMENGFAFIGQEGFRVNQISTVKEVIERLFPGYEKESYLGGKNGTEN